MLVPIAIFVACFVLGVAAASRLLPALDAGPVGGLAFFATCGLFGAGLGLIGMHIYEVAKTLEEFSGKGLEGLGKGEIVAGGIRAILYEAGTVLGLAVVVYLLAPRPADDVTDALLPAAD